MNILFVASDNSRTSGAFLCMAKLVSILQEKYGHNVLVVLPYKGTGTAVLDEQGVQYVLIRSYDWTVDIHEKGKIKSKLKHTIKVLLNQRAISKICNLIRNKNIDLVHINTSWSYVGAKAALKTNTPFIWHIREFLEEDQKREIWNKRKGYILMSKATRLLAVSKSIQKKYAQYIPENKLSVIYEGIDPIPYISLDHIILNQPKIQILIVGRVCEKKGQMNAVQACIDIHNSKYSNISLTIVGADTNPEALRIKEYVVTSKATDYITFEGSKKDTGTYYKTADITLMCSTSEAFGRVTVEAMMAGSLLIGTRSAGTSELIRHGENGLLYTVDDVKDLEYKICYAIEHVDEMRKIAKQGQTDMLKNMTAEINAEKVQNVYLNIFEGSKK